MRTCPACGRAERRTRYDLPRYRVVQCRGCGLLYNENFPEPQDLATTFSENYYRDVQGEAFAHVDDPAKPDASRPIYELGLRFVEQRAGVGRLLDVGCAFGSFLVLAESRGWAVRGVEISPFASRYARSTRGLDVYTGDLSEFRAAPGELDVITLWD